MVRKIAECLGIIGGLFVLGVIVIFVWKPETAFHSKKN